MQLLFFGWLGVTPKNGPKVEKGGLKKKKEIALKLELTQVLIKLKQKLFDQQLALD